MAGLVSSSLDNRLTLRTFSLYETRIPKASFKQKLERALSSSMSEFHDKPNTWRSRSVLPKSIDKNNNENKTNHNQPTLARNKSLKAATKLVSPVKERLKLPLQRSTSVQVKSHSPAKLKFHQIELEQEDAHFRRKQKAVDKQLKSWGGRNNFLQALIPAPEIPAPPPPVKVPKPPIERERIDLLIENLRVSLEYFWNVFQNAAKMTNLLKSLEGYNALVHAALFRNNEAARIPD